MPSTQTNVAILHDKIIELEKRQVSGQGLSLANMRQLEFFRRWRQFAGRDVVLVIRPKGVIERPGQLNRGKIVEVTDQKAADLMAFAGAREQEVREATPDEIKAYREFNLRQADSMVRKVAGERARMMQAQFEQIMGVTAGAVQPSVPASDPDLKPPVPHDEGKERAPDASSLVPDLNFGGDPAAAGEGSASGESEDSGDAPGASLLDVLTEAQVSALIDGGYENLQSIADAEPNELAEKVSGFGPKTATEVILKVSEFLAKLGEGDAAGDHDESAGSGDGA